MADRYFLLKIESVLYNMETIHNLSNERSQSTSLVSLILKAGADKKTASALISNELATAANIKSKQTRDGVTTALKAIDA